MAKVTLVIGLVSRTEIEAEIDDELTADEVIQSLVEDHFVPPVIDGSRNCYQFIVRGKWIIAEGKSFAQAGVCDGDRLLLTLMEPSS